MSDRMTSNLFDAEALVDAMAPLLGLTLTPESRAETIVHLRIAAERAEKLLSISLDDREEPAPVFTP
jgi:1-carboxybiuret hydrolase subunit AtzG-like